MLEKQFKSLQEAKQDNAEFEAQRKGAIAEAQRLSGVKKVIIFYLIHLIHIFNLSLLFLVTCPIIK